MSLKEFIFQDTQMSDAKEIVFFGGSFNPWHDGHSACIKLLPEDKSLIIIPDHNPYKEVVSNKADSLLKIQDEIRALKPQARLYSDFVKANRKNPTYFWLEALSQELPNKDYSLLMGFDSFTGLDKWIEAKQLVRLLKRIYVVSRLDNSAVREEQTKKLLSFNPKLEVIFLGGHPHEHLSSTKLRADS